jgi:hypothetical protein
MLRGEGCGLSGKVSKRFSKFFLRSLYVSLYVFLLSLCVLGHCALGSRKAASRLQASGHVSECPYATAPPYYPHVLPYGIEDVLVVLTAFQFDLGQ